MSRDITTHRTGNPRNQLVGITEVNGQHIITTVGETVFIWEHIPDEALLAILIDRMEQRQMNLNCVGVVALLQAALREVTLSQGIAPKASTP